MVANTRMLNNEKEDEQTVGDELPQNNVRCI